MYSIILVEDDLMQRNILKKMIFSIYKSIKIYEADSENAALDIIKNNDINMFLIDIGLKDSSGLNLAFNIRKIPKYEFSEFIFLTTNVNYMIQAFKQIHCYDYILKPYDKHDVKTMLNKLINKKIGDLSNKNCDLIEDEGVDKEFVIKLKNSIFVKIKISEILFIEVNGRNCEINTVSGFYSYTNISLKNILKSISCEYIVQSHKAFAINKNYIYKIEKLDTRLSKVYFKNYSKTALIGIKFKNNIIPEFKKIGKYYGA